MDSMRAAYAAIAWPIGLVMVVFGITQIIRPRSWLHYLPEAVDELLPTQPKATMIMHGFGNVTLGMLYVLGIKPLLLTWLVAMWWLSILPFAMWDDVYVGLRDIAIIGAIIAGGLILVQQRRSVRN